MKLTMAVLSLSALGALAAASPAAAGNFSPVPASGALCGGDNFGGPKIFNFDNSITINKNIEINKNFDFSKNIVINKSFDFSKYINIEKNIDLSKKIIINKNVDINVSAMAQAFASASAGAQAMTFVRGGGSTYVNVTGGGGGDIGQLTVETPCFEQYAQVVAAIHAECIDARGNHHPAVRMRAETWIDSSLDKELYRCLPGSTLRVVIGDVVHSDHGLAGVYEGGKVLACAPGEALRHFVDGRVNCAAAETVPDCTERDNLRRYGVGDLFFSYAARVCAVLAGAGRNYSAPSGEIQLGAMSLSGGVGSGY